MTYIHLQILQDPESIKWTFLEINKVWIYDMLYILFDVKLNGDPVIRLFNAKYLLLITWLKYQSKKGTNFFIEM